MSPERIVTSPAAAAKTATMPITYCVISHTHWDREWYQPFEQFRIRLVELIDHLLDIFAEYPDYIFHLDAQTVVLEDYLEIRPQRRAELECHIRAGRLLVGPWYVQNDFYLVSGEATVRNLLLGSRLATAFGRCDTVGYMPDQFGLISQLPQLLRGFGIDNAIFGRGILPGKETGSGPMPARAEFLWEGEDGSQVLTVHLPHWYNNAQRFSTDIEKAARYLELIKEKAARTAGTPYFLLMNGVDHLEAQENLLPILARLNAGLTGGETIHQTTMRQYLDTVRPCLPEPERWRGELCAGDDLAILQGTLSSRSYLKIMNAKAQVSLERQLEPISTMTLWAGFPSAVYDKDYLDYLWKVLLLNHPHDSICGCSVDPVHRHMEDRYARIAENTAMLLQRRFDVLTSHITGDGAAEHDYRLTVFNTGQRPRSEVVEVTVQFPVEEAVTAFTITDAAGGAQPYTILSHAVTERALLSPINLPGHMTVDSYRIQLLARDVPAMGYVSYLVKKAEHAQPQTGTPLHFANDFLQVTVHPSGQIDLTDRVSGHTYCDALTLEDREDAGDSYVYRASAHGQLVTTRDCTPVVETICDTPFRSSCRLRYTLSIPRRFNHAADQRDPETVEMPVEIILTLDQASRRLDVQIVIANTAEDHILRAVINTGIAEDQLAVSAPFDVLSRDRTDPIDTFNNDHTEAVTDFLNLDAGAARGFAIFTEGLHAYEHLENGRLAVVLLRATGAIALEGGHLPGDEGWRTPENQCKRTTVCRLALAPHAGTLRDAAIAVAATEFMNPVLCHYNSIDPKRFSGGRPCVQDSEVMEIFFRDDPYPTVTLPPSQSYLTLNNDQVVLTALKQAENKEGIVVRAFNTTSEPQTLTLVSGVPITAAYLLNLNEERQAPLAVTGAAIGPITLAPKQIVTVEIVR